jgi:hypothetical protein
LSLYNNSSTGRVTDAGGSRSIAAAAAAAGVPVATIAVDSLAL